MRRVGKDAMPDGEARLGKCDMVSEVVDVVCVEWRVQRGREASRAEQRVDPEMNLPRERSHFLTPPQTCSRLQQEIADNSHRTSKVKR